MRTSKGPRFGIPLSALLAGIVFVSSARATEAYDIELPRSMAAMGDSITAGALAAYRRQEAMLPWVQGSLLSRGLKYFVTKKIGEVEQRHLSWSTGLDRYARVLSHAQRLNRLSKLRGEAPPVIFNAAVSGASSDDENDRMSLLRTQLPNVLEWSRRELKRGAPDYVTVLIGGNDICATDLDSMTSERSYHRSMAQVIDTLLAADPETKVLVSAVPDIQKLSQVASGARLLPPLVKSCQSLWNLAKICPTLTLLKDPASQAVVAARVREFNNVLTDLVESRAAIYGDRVRFAGAAAETPFTSRHLSLDCFHPNPEGQQLLADATWPASWWASATRSLERRLSRSAIEAERAQLEKLRAAGERQRAKCTIDALRGRGKLRDC